MRIATFNLESLDVPPKADVALEERCAVLRPQLERLEADVLCLQEVNGQHRAGELYRSLEALDELLAGTPYATYARAATTGPDGHGVADVHNLVTLSRWPICASREIRNTLVCPLTYRLLTADPPEECAKPIGFERPILLTTVRPHAERTIAILNLHLRAPLASPIAGQKEGPFAWKSISAWAEGYFLSAWKRSAQALEARLAVDQLFDEDLHRPIVVAGDFNAEDHETPLRILVGADDDTGNGRLAIRSLVVLDRALPADRRFSTLHHGRPAMLDHILASQSLLAHFHSIEVHNETLGDEVVGFSRTLHKTRSYHAPVVAELALSRTAATGASAAERTPAAISRAEGGED
jgi:endonuclease/exonuclease/phosphatase family metal-dependent hydrolase